MTAQASRKMTPEEIAAKILRGITFRYADDQACVETRIMDSIEVERAEADSRVVYEAKMRLAEVEDFRQRMEEYREQVAGDTAWMQRQYEARLREAKGREVSEEEIHQLAVQGSRYAPPYVDEWKRGFRAAMELRAREELGRRWPDESVWMEELKKELAMYLDCEVIEPENLWRIALYRLRSRLLGDGK